MNRNFEQDVQRAREAILRTAIRLQIDRVVFVAALADCCGDTAAMLDKIEGPLAAQTFESRMDSFMARAKETYLRVRGRMLQRVG